MIGFVAKKIFGTRNERVIRSFNSTIARINELESSMRSMSDDSLRQQTDLFRQRLEKGEHLDSLIPEAFATVREASRRVLNMRHFDVQLLGGLVLHTGRIAEMKTGEGKTLVATLPSYLNALTGKGVHVVTVNDYLARRDAEWMGRLHSFLGLSVGCIHAGMREETKREAYLSDITYGQNNEFGFDYLRDNMRFSRDDMYQRGHHFAIVDEVDSILIDEARTPLIISGPAEESTDKYIEINRIIPYLKKDTHFQVEAKTKQPSLTEEGTRRVEELMQIDNLFDPNNIEVLHHVNQALRAYTTLERDVDYVVKDGEVIIVDEFTGRLMPGRRWSNGLHQAVEAKEGLQVARENQTLASITFQNYFRMYSKLSGMTGTADTEAVEFKHIYGLEVVVMPPNRPMVRKDTGDIVYRTRKEKYDAVCQQLVEINKTGQPVLVGTISIEQSEFLSRHLQKLAIPHNVLNAKQHEREAEIVAQAGRYGAVTISTNMAGRGTDILLGGNPEFLAAAEAKTKDLQDPTYQAALERYRATCEEEKRKVIEAGGLFIIGTERHESRRIDNQLRGRAGRQGDPGCSQFYISLEDELMLRFGGEWMQNIMQRVGWEEGIALDGRLISRSIETAQKRVEAFHFDSRKHVTEYDDVMNKQRQVIYNMRMRILSNEGIRDEVRSMVDDLIEETVLSNCPENLKPTQWNLEQVTQRFIHLFHRESEIAADIRVNRQQLFDALRTQAQELYDTRLAVLDEKLARIGALSTGENSPIAVQISRGKDKPFDFSTIEQDTLLETLDHYWNLHLQEMDHLREGIGLRGYGQKNPLHEYQREGFLLFQGVLNELKETVVRKLYYYDVPDATELVAHFQEEMRRREEVSRQMQMVHETPQAVGAQSSTSAEPQPTQAAAPMPAPAFSHGGQVLELAPEKDPVESRARLEAQRKARRKASKK